MPKRTGRDGDTSVNDAPEVIATRRKAKVSSRYRRTESSGSSGMKGAPASSAFPGMAVNPPLGFVFGTTSTAPETTSTAVPSTSSLSGSAPLFFGATKAPAPTTSISAPPTNTFSFLDKKPSTAPPAVSKLPEIGLSSGEPVRSPPSAFVAPETSLVREAAHSSVTSSSASGKPFGEGATAAQGKRLNKLFASWISHQIATNSASSLDIGLRDYVTFAAQIRNRAEFSKPDSAPAGDSTYTHPPAPGFAASPAVPLPKPHGSSTAAVQAPVAGVPTPAAAPSPAPVTSAPTFSFPAPSTLPPASSGPQFSFAVPSAPVSSTIAPGTPAVITPSTTSPVGGFKFNSGAFGNFGSSIAPSPGVFNGFQVPAGVSIAPPAPAGAAGGGATDAEEDGMPREDPSKLERAPGEEQEEIMGHFRAKLFRFKMDEKVWGDMGVGLLRLMKHTENNARRLVLRNDMGKVVLNSAVCQGMKVTKVKSAVKLMANMAGDGPTPVMIKVTPNQSDQLYDSVLALVPS